MPANPPTMTAGLLDAKAVAQLYGIHEVVVYRWVRANRIPSPVVQRHRYTRWSAAEIHAHIAGLRESEKQEAAS